MIGTPPLTDSVDVVEHVKSLLDDVRRHACRAAAPFTTLTYAQSIDGCIATRRRETLQLSNPQSLRMTHQLRSLHDAILVGINTVLADDPRLTVRLVDGPDPQPIVVDSRLRFPLQAQLLRAKAKRPWIIASDDACSVRERRLTDAGATIVRLPRREDGLIDLELLKRRLGEMGVRCVMVEGGARIITTTLAARLADQLVLTISPAFVGGMRAFRRRDESGAAVQPRLANLHYQALGGDLIVRGDLCSTDEGD